MNANTPRGINKQDIYTCILKIKPESNCDSMQTCYSIICKDHDIEAEQNTIFNISPLFRHSPENTLISNWT